jgi:hypothetical protein
MTWARVGAPRVLLLSAHASYPKHRITSHPKPKQNETRRDVEWDAWVRTFALQTLCFWLVLQRGSGRGRGGG